MREKVIKVSSARVPRFGTGVFLTDLEPTLNTHDIIENNWTGSYNHYEKTQCAFALPRNELKIIRLRDPLSSSRNVYRSDEAIYLDGMRYYLVMRDHKLDAPKPSTLTASNQHNYH